MGYNKAHDAYRQKGTKPRIHPVKLVHLLFSRVLIHLEHAEEAILADDPRRRGENLSKAIAIVAELHASINPEDKSDAAVFLRGLYEAILRELPKISLSNDLKLLKQAYAYLARLKEIWEQEALPHITRETGMSSANHIEDRLASSSNGNGYKNSDKLSVDSSSFSTQG